MSYNPQRRAPNVSEYIANLNTVAPEPPLPDEGDLSVFTNAEFFDFDMAESARPIGGNELLLGAEGAAGSGGNRGLLSAAVSPAGDYKGAGRSFARM